jgi:hypothetical protein
MTGTAIVGAIFGFARSLAGRLAESFSVRTIRVRVVVFKDAGLLCAQCLEYDIAVQAKTIDELQRNLDDALMSQLDISAELGREPFEGVPPAPPQFFNIFESARSSSEKEQQHLIKPTSDMGQMILPEMRFA